MGLHWPVSMHSNASTMSSAKAFSSISRNTPIRAGQFTGVGHSAIHLRKICSVICCGSCLCVCSRVLTKSALSSFSSHIPSILYLQLALITTSILCCCPTASVQLRLRSCFNVMVGPPPVLFNELAYNNDTIMWICL